MDIRSAGVVGLGTMGAGIAEVLARAGLTVTAVEADPDALARGMSMIDSSLGKAASRGRLTEQQHREIASRVQPAAAMASMADADLVVEVVPEQLPIKRKVVAELDRVLRPEAIIATNTSSLSVTAIAADSACPGRVVGMHFFNPAPVMRLVEVVTTVLTEPESARTVTALAERIGKTPVQVTDRAGFVANALLLPYLNHAVRLLETGYAACDDIDLAVTAGIGLPMGPLALLDLIGLDTSLAILEALEREFGGTRYTPAPMLRRLADAGQTGRKSGRGFYDYRQEETGQTSGKESAELPAPPGTVTLIDPSIGRPASPNSDRAEDLASLLAAAGVSVSWNPVHPTDLALVVIGPEGGVLGPARAAGRTADAVGMHLPHKSLAELVPSALTSAAALGRARALVARLGLTAVRSADRPGLLVGALLFPHLRDAVAMAADGYAAPRDVDTAMTLGCGYPRGPMRLLADVGPELAVDVLSAMHAGYGDPAFAPPPLLREYALGGLPGALSGAG